jgi:O-antigen/teichoic acid export membrane protein
MSARKVWVSTASQIGGRFIGLGIALVSTKILATYLGPEGIGNYNTILAVAGFAVVIGDLGLFSTVVRELSKHPDRQATIAATVFKLRLYSAVLIAALFSGITALLPLSAELQQGLLLVGLYVLWNLLGSFYDMILQTRLQMQFSALAETLSKLIGLAVLVLVVRLELPLWGAIAAYSSAAATATLIKYFLSKRLSFGPGTYDAQVARSIMIAAVPLGAIYLVNNLFFRMDTLILRGIDGAEVTGWYTTAYRVLEVTLFIGTYFASSLKPILSESIDSDPERVANVVNKALGVLLAAAIPVTLSGLFFSREIILFLSDSRFLPGSYAMIILSLTLPLIYFDSLLGEVLVAKDRRKTLLTIALCMVGLNLTLNLVLIPWLSLNGAALATFTTELVLLTTNWLIVRKIITLRIDWQQIQKIILATSVLCLIFWLTPGYFLIRLILGTVIYGIILIRSGAVRIPKR